MPGYTQTQKHNDLDLAVKRHEQSYSDIATPFNVLKQDLFFVFANAQDVSSTD